MIHAFLFVLTTVTLIMMLHGGIHAGGGTVYRVDDTLLHRSDSCALPVAGLGCEILNTGRHSLAQILRYQPSIYLIGSALMIF